MKKKSGKLVEFMNGLHEFVISSPQFRKKTSDKTEKEIQTEIRPIIIRYLEEYFKSIGIKDSVRAANDAFYWEGQEGKYGSDKILTFGSKNYPDFIVTKPYVIAIEYKQSPSGSTLKHGIGQSIMHTLCEEFHYVYLLFHDQSEDKRIQGSEGNEKESYIIEKMWSEFNVMIRFV